jgi:hypothetical protein
MLKYGEISLINNGNSKSLVPRNLTYRQKELVKSNINNSEILNIINTNIIENINTNNIISDNANINVINSSILNVDLINKKTSTNNEIIINNKLQITNQDLSFNYLLSNNSIFKANSLNIQIPEIKIEGYLDFSNNNIKFYKPLDLSANGIIKFGSNLQFNNGSFNIITINSTSIDTSANINLLNNTPEIKFKDRLKLYNTTYSDNSSNPILIYNTSFNDYEKKYLKKVTIGITDISMNVYFCNIINNSMDILTFTGKIVSVSNITNSLHIIFQGYSRIINGINTVFFTTNILFSSYPTNWTIRTMTIINNNLIMIISDEPIISNYTSNWIISLESISINS